MSRIAVQRADGITSYKLSRIVAELKSLRGIKKPVLRALADHYPNVFPSVVTIAMQAGFGTTKTREALRALEAEGFISALSAKVGGREKPTQYVLSVSKILALHQGQDTQHQPLPFEIENPTPSDGIPNTSRQETQHHLTQNPTPSVGEQRSEQRIEQRERRETASPSPTDTIATKGKNRRQNTDTGDDLSFHLSSLSVRERGGQKASLSPKDAAKDKSADYDWIVMQMAANSWPTTPRTEQIVRHYLNDGHSRETIAKAIRAVMKSMPGKEGQPGLYLAQNLEGHINLLIAESRGEITRRNSDLRSAPDYLKEPSRGSLKGKELEEHEKHMAAVRQKMDIGVVATAERAYPQLPRSDR